MNKINNIQTEFLTNPIGIDILHPKVTWSLEGITTQTAYEIEYTVNGVKASSGKIKSSSMNYTFKEDFNSRDRIEFYVNVYDENNQLIKSDLNYFEYGLLHPDDFSSKWISGSYHVNKNKRYPADYFQKEFKASKITKARLYITACGIYQASINGKNVSDAYLTPGSTDYQKRLQVQTFDVTNLLKEGLNNLQVILADGWYRGSIGAKGFTYTWGKVTKFIAQLEMYDENGKKETLISDESFKWSNDGEIRFADLKDGEIVDFRKSPTYQFSARPINFKPNYSASNSNYVILKEKEKPISKIVTPSGKMLFEFKNNVAGIIELKVQAHAGDTIDITLGEMLKDGELTLSNIQCERKGKKTPLQEIHLICKEGLNEYLGKFMIAGFKYASISSSVPIEQENLSQIALYTDLKQTGFFHCSDELINIFFENTLRSLKSNSIDIPTDCPTRERMGWTGDSQVFFETASFLTNYASFTRKHLVDVFDRQKKNGCLPQIAPYSHEDWFMNVMNGSVGWADVGILSPYRYYQKYGDKRILEDHFAGMEKYADFMIKRCGEARGIYAVYAKPLHYHGQYKKYIINNGQSYGEWAEPNDVKAFQWTDFCCPHPEESMAYTVFIMEHMMKICEILGHMENYNKYQEYAEGVKHAYQDLVDQKTFDLDTNRQAKLVRPLYMHLLNNEQEEYAKRRLIEALDFYDWRLGTGFLSTPFILYVLSELNPEYAYKLLENKKLPGWLYMAVNNTGTIWEGWEGPMSQKGISSLNHYSKGAMAEWLFKGMCGIHIIKENTFEISPVIGGTITNASAKYDSIYGSISSSWKKDEEKITFEIDVPSNTHATFIYKDLKKELDAGHHILYYSK